MSLAHVVLGAVGTLGAAYVGWFVSKLDRTRAAQIKVIADLIANVGALTLALLHLHQFERKLKVATLDTDHARAHFHKQEDMIGRAQTDIARIIADRYLIGVAWGQAADGLLQAVSEYTRAATDSLGLEASPTFGPAHDAVFAEIARLERFKRRWWRRLLP